MSSLNIFVKTFFSLVITWSLFVLPATFLTTPGSRGFPTSNRERQYQPSKVDSLPLNFELNQGQTHRRAKFIARTEGYVLFLTPTEAVMALENPAAHRKGKESDLESREEKARPPRSIVRMKLKGSNPASQIEGLNQSTTTSNYFAGANPTVWRTNIPNYARVRYAQVYPGIDMVYYGNDRRLEYDFIVAPGSDPQLIEMAFGGIQNFEISSMGDLVLHTQQGDIRQSKPVAYQEVNGVKEEVPVSYVAKSERGIGFLFGAYDSSKPLIIDPVLIYSTYLGGSKIINGTEDWGEAIAVDSFGSAYVTGYTYSPDFPVTAGAFDTSRAGLDAFITKFTPDGAALIYSTFLGGAGREQGQGIAVDVNGNAYVTGITESFDSPFTSAYEGFPVTSGAFQTKGSYDAFVTKLNSKGSALVYSTYLGGTADVDRGWAIALDEAGNACITGDTASTNFPISNPIQAFYGGQRDAYVTKLNAAGSALVYSTFLGGNLSDEGRGIACKGNDVFVTGDTSSGNFPTSNPLQGNNGGGLQNHDDSFVVRIGDIGPVPTPTPTPTPTPRRRRK